MKKTRILGLLSVALVVLSLLTVISLAASDSPNYSYTVDKEEVKAGDVITLVVECDEMTVSTSGFEIDFDKDALELTSTVKARVTYYDAEWESNENKNFTIVSTQAEANATGHIGAAFIGTSDVTYNAAKQVCKLTFKVKDGASGTTTIAVTEESSGADGYKGAIGTTTLTIVAPHTCTLTHVPAVSANCTTNGNIEYWYCSDAECAKFYSDAEGTVEITDKASVNTGIDANNHAWGEPTSYTNNNDGTHTANYVCGNNVQHTKSDAAVAHVYDKTTHKCVCGDVEKFELCFTKDNGDVTIFESVMVPFGAKVSEYLPDESAIADVVVNSEFEIGVYKFDGTWVYDAGETRSPLENDDTMPAKQFVLIAEYSFTGWSYGADDNNNVGWSYSIDNEFKTGWNLIDGAWYYLDTVTGYRAEGVARVPYPTEKINGVEYKADAEAIAYAANKGESFIDAESALFVFDENGKFQNTMTGLTTYKDATRYVVNGMLTWHPGFVTVDDTLYYFIGDLVNGGNVPANGETYITKVNGVEGYKAGDIVTFVNGQIKTDLDGIVNGCYYENGKLAYGKGLVALDVNGETKYIFVRSNGQLAFGEYWISADKLNGLPVKAKMYDFGRDGYLQNPVDPSLNGVVDGYFYENGSVAYGAGLVEWNGDVYYVRSNGQVATGTYYVTNLGSYEGDDIKVGDKLNFADDGKLLESKNGVIDGYYYEKNVIVYGAGLIEWNGDVYYVRSNGQVATGTYYVTNVANYKGDDIKSGDKLVFAEDGKLIK